MKSELATKIEWNNDGHKAGQVNINAAACTVEIDGTTISIPAGFFCSWVTTDDIIGWDEEQHDGSLNFN